MNDYFILFYLLKHEIENFTVARDGAWGERNTEGDVARIDLAWGNLTARRWRRTTIALIQNVHRCFIIGAAHGTRENKKYEVKRYSLHH